MVDQKQLEEFAKKRPLAMMTRVILGEVISSELDSVFEQQRSRNYCREMLYSSMCHALADVVLTFCRTPNQAYVQHREQLRVSKTAFYNKLKNVELDVSRGSVQHSYQQCTRMLQELGFRPWEYLPGYHCKVVDGNHLQACENRLSELRTTWAAALPGTAVAVLDAGYQLIEDILLLEDGHAQERTVFDQLLETVQENDLIVCDRHYCTQNFLLGIAERSGYFVIRQHGALRVESAGPQKFVGYTETGEVYEQKVWVGGSNGIKVRRVTLLLDEPTRDGDTELHILTNVPVKDANAIKIAELYRWRWDIEHIFYLASTTLTCEVDGLNYPKGNLFVFCMAMMAMNCRQVLMGALVAAHGEWVEEEISHYSVSHEISRSFDSVLAVFDEDRWNALLPTDFTVRMKFLKAIAKNVHVSRHRKARRGPKKTPPKKTPYKNGSHLSVQKVLEQRKQTC